MSIRSSAPPPRVFVISLEARTDRRAAVRRRLGRLGIEFEFFAAVDGRSTAAPALYDRERRLRLVGKDLLPGEIGCYLSHLAVLRRMLELRLPHAVVLEDDVVVSDAFPRVLRALGAASPEIDLIKLGSASARPRAYRPVRRLLPEAELVRFNGTVNGTQGYFITAAGAAKFLRYSSPFAYPVDVALNRVWENDLTVLGVQPWPILHDRTSPTSIEAERFARPAEQSLALTLERRARKARDSLAKRLHFLLAAGTDRRLAGPPLSEERAGGDRVETSWAA